MLKYVLLWMCVCAFFFVFFFHKCSFLNAVLRALGIPSRCISNFRSAHDSDYNTTIDAHWTVDGRPRKTMDDAIWLVD